MRHHLFRGGHATLAAMLLVFRHAFMKDFLQAFLRNLGLLILRASFGIHLAFLHGFGKLRTFPSAASSFPDPLTIGHRWSMTGTIAGEFLCSILLALGMGTRLAAAGVAFTMGVAAFVVHKGHPWDQRELALLYFTVAVVVVLLGPGRYSLDRVLLPKLLRRKGSSSGGASVHATTTRTA